MTQGQDSARWETRERAVCKVARRTQLQCQSAAQHHDSPDNSKHGVEVFAVPTMKGDLDEVLDYLHPFGLVGFTHNLRGDPEGLLIDEVLEVAQVAGRLVWTQLEEVGDVIGGLDAGKEQVVARRELIGYLRGAQRQQTDLRFPLHLLGLDVRAQRLRLHVALKVVPEMTTSVVN